MNELEFWEDILAKNKEPIYETIVQNYDVIKSELLRLIKFRNILSLSYPHKKNKSYFAGECEGWRLFPLLRLSRDPVTRKRIKKIFLLYPDLLSFIIRFICPKTYSLFESAVKENIISGIAFAELSPNAHIPEHIHPIGRPVHPNHRKRMMYHLGIICDPKAEITVGNKTKSWKEGEVLSFKSTGPYRHSVIHKGEKNRIIFGMEVSVEYLKKYGVS